MTASTDANSSAGAGRTIISVDAMGGDRGPATVVAGISLFAKTNPGISFILHGPTVELHRLVARKKNLAGRVEIRDAQGVVTMDDKPTQVMRTGKDTSMWSAIDSVRNGEATVCVSCGNTGALMTLSVVRLRKLAGVNRPAIAVLWPSTQHAGLQRHAGCRRGYQGRCENDLLQYALMGASYARNGLDLARPRIGLLNNGTEEHKGRAELKAAHDLIADQCGRGEFRVRRLRRGRRHSRQPLRRDRDGRLHRQRRAENRRRHGQADFRIPARCVQILAAEPLAALLAYSSLRRLGKRMDPRRVNGGVFLGLNGTVVKSHGGADATGVSAAVKLAFPAGRIGVQRKAGGRGLHPLCRCSKIQMPQRKDAELGAKCRRKQTDKIHDELRAVVRGVGHYLPARGAQQRIRRHLDTSDEWIRVSRSGIERRHFAAEGETTSKMAAEAARNGAGRCRDGWPWWMPLCSPPRPPT